MRRKLTTVFLIAIAILLPMSTGCKRSSSTPTEPVDTTSNGGHGIARKPNIYLYPLTESVVSVKLELPLGGSIIESSPAYLGEWRVGVKPSGKIDNKYDYLFYECQTPDVYQYKTGWVVRRDSLSIFFRANLSEAGFNEHEINDFTAYWISRLINYPYYIIYPQFSNDIDKMIKLRISPSPDNMLRLFYAIKGSEKGETVLSKPVIPAFERKRFVVVEWGVVLK